MKKDRNRRFVHTRYVDEAGAWYALDNAGIIMPPVSNSVNTSLFRLEMRLDAPVDREIMGRALAETARRFSYFNVRLRRGFFWYYFEQRKNPPRLYEDSIYPSQDWNINRRGSRLIRVRVHGNRIALECSHALSDGSGALSFLKTLVTRYFALQGIEPGAELGVAPFEDILPTDRLPSSEECEDGYQRYLLQGCPSPEREPKAWHIESERLPVGQYRMTIGTLPLGDTLAAAKERGASLTEFLAAVYLYSLQAIWRAQHSDAVGKSPGKRPEQRLLSLEIPVNLRKFFPSKTNRNFSLYILLKEDMGLGFRDLDELIMRTHCQMKLGNDSKSIQRQISRNARSARNMAVRIVPLALKDIFARMIYASFGETTLSGFLSNVGVVSLPPAIAPHVEGINFFPAPSTCTLTNASVISWNDTLSICFGSLAKSRELERLFFTTLRGLGIPVAVRCREQEE